MEEKNLIQTKYYDDMSKDEQRTLCKEYKAANHKFCFFCILKNKKAFFYWLENSKEIYKNRSDEYFKRCECKEMDKQYEIIRGCVWRAIDDWVHEGFAGSYATRDFETVCLCVANEISGSIINHKNSNIQIIEKSLIDNYFDEFDDEALTRSFSKIAAQICQNLSVSLPEEVRFILPKHLWSYWDDYWANYEKKQIIERLQTGLILEKPTVIIPWNITLVKLNELLRNYDLKKITDNYYCVKATILRGLDCMIGLHLDAFGIKYFEIFKDEKYFKDHIFEESYNEIQRHIELIFGKSHSTIKNFDVGFDSHVWQIRKRKIRHYVFDRFGLEEHFHIER